MKYLVPLIFAIAVLFSCTKDNNKLDPQHGSDCTTCTAAESDFSVLPEGVEEIVVRELKTDPSCGCIVEGEVKYVKEGRTILMLDYGCGECDAWVVRTTCPNGKCKSKSADCCKFMLDCGGYQVD